MNYYTTVCMARQSPWSPTMIVSSVVEADRLDDAFRGFMQAMRIDSSWSWCNIAVIPFPGGWPGAAKLLDPLPKPVVFA